MIELLENIVAAAALGLIFFVLYFTSVFITNTVRAFCKVKKD